MTIILCPPPPWAMPGPLSATRCARMVSAPLPGERTSTALVAGLSQLGTRVRRALVLMRAVVDVGNLEGDDGEIRAEAGRRSPSHHNLASATTQLAPVRRAHRRARVPEHCSSSPLVLPLPLRRKRQPHAVSDLTACVPPSAPIARLLLGRSCLLADSAGRVVE